MPYSKVKVLKFVLLILVIAGIHLSASAQYNLVVAKDGSGNHTTVQAAIDAAPAGQTEPFRIFIKNGTYKEKITIPSTKPFIHLIGENVAKVSLTNDDFSGKLRPDGTTFGTSNSASVTINATDFYAANITFENTTGESPQAVAVNANNDRIAFYNCRFLGGQDTLLTNGLTGPRQYYKNCFIDGTVDFIFGGAKAIFENCTMFCRDRTNAGSSYLTAANTQSGIPYGYVFINCVIPSNRGNTNYFLGRPWQNDGTSTTPSHSKTVFLNTKMGKTILPEGWSVWNANTNTSVITYAEYKSKTLSGAVLDIKQRVPWSKQLTDAEAQEYTLSKIFTDWDVCKTDSLLCKNSWTPEPAISNFKIIKGTPVSASKISWNSCWPIAGIKYDLLRADVKSGPYTSVKSISEPTDTNVVFDLQDTIPSPAKIFYYIIKSSKPGLKDYFSDTLTVSSIPTIVSTTLELKDMRQNLGSPGTSRAYALTGENLLGTLNIQIPDNFQISADSGKTWVSKELKLNPVDKTIPTRNMLVRLNALSIGNYTGNIRHFSSSADTLSISVSGTTANAVLKESKILLFYPYSVNEKDSTGLRGEGILPTVATFSNLSVSNGMSNGGATALPPYSLVNGLAVSSGFDGAGNWSTNAGGPGGTLRRNYYVQYQIITDGSRDIKVDSLILNSVFYLTSSSTRLAVAYSRTGFINDSTDIVGGIGPNGLPLPSNGFGSFANPIALPQDNNANNTNYRLLLSENGIQLRPKDTLTVRLYFSCSSSSAGRYAKIRNLHFKGDIVNPYEGVLQYFPFTENDKDVAFARNKGVKEGLMRLNNMSVSNGMNNANSGVVPPFSAERGIALSSGSDGAGLWSASAGGPGGTLRRHIYTEFVIQPQSSKKINVDSLILNTSFYFTASSTRLAVVYSKDGFVTDSSDISQGGIGPDGLPLPANGFGSFANGAAVAQENATTTRTYRLPLNGAKGVEILPNQTLTVRLYYSCSSGTAGRYAKIKDMYWKGSSSDAMTTSTTEELHHQKLFSLFQNPVNNTLTIDHKTLQSAPNFNIYNANGQLILKSTGSNEGRSVIDIELLSTGKFILQAISESNSEVIHFIKH